MSKKIKIMILLTVFATVSILLTNILISSAKEKLDSESTYTIVMDGQTTTVEKELTEEDYDVAQKIMEERAKGNKSVLADSNQSESVQRAVEELEMIQQLVSDEIERQDTNSLEEVNLKEPESIAVENENMKNNLKDIAKKYNKYEEFNKLMKKIEKQEDSSEFTKERIQICELFINIYDNNEVDEQEKKSIKDFLGVINLGDVPNSLKSQIDTLID